MYIYAVYNNIIHNVWSMIKLYLIDIDLLPTLRSALTTKLHICIDGTRQMCVEHLLKVLTQGVTI